MYRPSACKGGISFAKTVLVVVPFFVCSKPHFGACAYFCVRVVFVSFLVFFYRFGAFGAVLVSFFV